MLGPVIALAADHLWMGKPPRCRTRHPRLLSLSRPLWVGWNEHPAKAGRVLMMMMSKRAHCMIHQPVSVVLQCGAGAWLKELASGDQH